MSDSEQTHGSDSGGNTGGNAGGNESGKAGGNESGPSPWPVVITGIVIVVLIGLVFASVFLRDEASSAAQKDAPQFDPSKFPELAIKGVPTLGDSSWSAIEVPAMPADSAELLRKGRTLFAKACAGCHGANGEGDGPLVEKAGLSTAPADLRHPIRSIKIRSTVSGTAPVKEDLFRTITRGLPGTAMLSFRELPAEDRWALVAYVRSLSPDYEKLQGMPIKIPAKLPVSKDLLEVGQVVFERSCRNCHGENGLGSSSGIYDARSGKPWPGLAFARHHGQRMLGGNSGEDIARTLLAGFSQRDPMMSWMEFFYPEAHPAPEAKAAMDRRFWGTVWYVRQLATGADASAAK